MKNLFWSLVGLLFLSASTLNAQIFADVETSLGSFSIELDYVNTPMTVANFIRLAEGSAAWLDMDTGVLRRDPFYDGIIFHRVISGFMSQTGSPNGMGTDGPGYTFPDEVEFCLPHDQAYRVSMANSGPNSNGSQIFITAAATAWLDGLHTVFGTVVSGTAICDAINAVAVDGSSRPLVPVSIVSVSIRRVGAAAEAFNEHEQGVPALFVPDVTITHDGTSATLLFDQGEETKAQVYVSEDLESWSGQSRYSGPGDGLLTSFPLVAETTGMDLAFFAVSLVDYSDFICLPSRLANYTLTFRNVYSSSTDEELGDITYVFDDTGGGTYTSQFDSGSIVSYNYSSDGIGGVLLVYHLTFPPFRYRLGADDFVPPLFSGRAAATAYLTTTSLSLTMDGFSLQPTLVP
ncbi:peptidylprolyl isomerase [Kiritimatiellota bacterium B12222]|nr:peptidylprolyl isomerase [Kiritimatiellota bacterium B12222]